MSQPNYKYSGQYVANFQHLRDLNSSLRDDLLRKDGGIITGGIFENSQTTGNRLATRQFVTDAVTAGGGGSGALSDEIKTSDSSTSVKTVANGVEFKDDATLIATLSLGDSTTTKLKGNLNGVVIATDDLTIKTKDESATIATFNNSQIQTTASILQNAIQGTSAGHLTRKDYVDSAIETAKGQITKLVDANTLENPVANNYQLKIDNNSLEFSRGLASDDTYLKVFGTTVGSSDAVVLSSNRSNFYHQSEDSVQPDVNYYLTHVQDLTAGSTYRKTAPLRMTTGFASGNIPYASITALNLEGGATNASTTMTIHPKNSTTSAIVNKVNSNIRMGYSATADVSQQDADSILKRSENDTRYYQTTQTLDQIASAVGNVSLGNNRLLNVANPTHPRDAVPLEFADGRYYEQTQRLDEIVVPQLPLNLNSQKIINLAPAESLNDAVTFNQLQTTRQAYSTVRKTTTALTNTTKVTGFTVSEEFNANQNCYFDVSNQTFLVTTAFNTNPRIKFTCNVKFNIGATGNTATIVMRDFTNSVNYADTTMTLAQQNQTGTFERSFSVIKSFNTNRFIGLYVTAINGSPPFSALDITFTAESVYVSTAINKLADELNMSSISMSNGGLVVDQPNQQWFLNGATLFGGVVVNSNSDFDVLTPKLYVDQTVFNSLAQQDGYRFMPINNANSFAIQKISTQTYPFIIQTDVSNASTFTVQNDLRLIYSGTKTHTNDSLMTKADVQALINASGGSRQSYVAFVYAGDFQVDANFGWDSSPSGIITSIGRTTQPSVQSIDINHTAIPFRHRVFIQKYSNTFSTNDNDESTQYWIADHGEPTINKTQTRICYEHLGSGIDTNTQNIGFNVMWIAW